MTTVKVYKNKKGKIIGRLLDGEYQKVVYGSKHRLKMFDAWGIDEYVIEDIKDKAKIIRIQDKETKTIYKILFTDWERHAIHKDFDTPQQFVPLKCFTIENSRQPKLI